MFIEFAFVAGWTLAIPPSSHSILPRLMLCRPHIRLILMYRPMSGIDEMIT